MDFRIACRAACTYHRFKHNNLNTICNVYATSKCYAISDKVVEPDMYQTYYDRRSPIQNAPGWQDG